MHSLNRFCFSLLVAIVMWSALAHGQEDVGGIRGFADRESFWLRNDRGHLIFFAVLEGLYADGVSDEVVASVIPPSGSDGRHDSGRNFVYACPLCEPAFEAFRLYAARPAFQNVKNLPGRDRIDTFGEGLDAEVERKLLSDDDGVRRPALQALIQDWIGRYMARMRLTEEERAAWEQRMENGRKEGMGYLKSKTVMPDTAWENCAVCDAAAGACAREEANETAAEGDSD